MIEYGFPKAEKFRWQEEVEFIYLCLFYHKSGRLKSTVFTNMINIIFERSLPLGKVVYSSELKKIAAQIFSSQCSHGIKLVVELEGVLSRV